MGTVCVILLHFFYQGTESVMTKHYLTFSAVFECYYFSEVLSSVNYIVIREGIPPCTELRMGISASPYVLMLCSMFLGCIWSDRK
jgi:hypothetical protein